MGRATSIYGFLIGMLCLGLGACEEQTTWEMGTVEPILVVDAIITSENKPQEVYVYQSSGELNELPLAVSEAQVRLWDGYRLYDFLPAETPGKYLSAPFAASINRTYVLLINYGEMADTALAVMSPISPFKNDTVREANGLFKFEYRGSDLPAMTEVYYHWAFNTDYCQRYGSCSAQSTFYTLNNMDVSEEFGPAKQEIWFPRGTTLIRKKYSLSKNHQDFIRSLLIETEWRGGLFDTEQGNVPTNFNNGVQGWFGVCMVLSDTIVIE